MTIWKARSNRKVILHYYNELQQRAFKSHYSPNTEKSKRKKNYVQRQHYSLDYTFFSVFRFIAESMDARDGLYIFLLCIQNARKSCKLSFKHYEIPIVREVFLVWIFRWFGFGLAFTHSMLKCICPVCRWVVYSGQRL